MNRLAVMVPVIGVVETGIVDEERPWVEYVSDEQVLSRMSAWNDLGFSVSHSLANPPKN